jgi:hypothetical protein
MTMIATEPAAAPVELEARRCFAGGLFIWVKAALPTGRREIQGPSKPKYQNGLPEALLRLD